jgi:hypothetical protein
MKDLRKCLATGKQLLHEIYLQPAKVQEDAVPRMYSLVEDVILALDQDTELSISDIKTIQLLPSIPQARVQDLIDRFLEGDLARSIIQRSVEEYKGTEAYKERLDMAVTDASSDSVPASFQPLSNDRTWHWAQLTFGSKVLSASSAHVSLSCDSCLPGWRGIVDGPPEDGFVKPF